MHKAKTILVQRSEVKQPDRLFVIIIAEDRQALRVAPAIVLEVGCVVASQTVFALTAI